jgi:hypothetical protein
MCSDARVSVVPSVPAREHTRLISPVMTNASGAEALKNRTVVSSVLGKQLEKSVARSGSRMRPLMSSITCGRRAPSSLAWQSCSAERGARQAAGMHGAARLAGSASSAGCGAHRIDDGAVKLSLIWWGAHVGQRRLRQHQSREAGQQGELEGRHVAWPEQNNTSPTISLMAYRWIPYGSVVKLVVGSFRLTARTNRKRTSSQ